MLIEPWKRQSLQIRSVKHAALGRSTRERTLNIGHALVENLLQHLGVLQLLLHLGDDGLGQLLLLALLDLALVADPGVQDSLGLSS